MDSRDIEQLDDIQKLLDKGDDNELEKLESTMAWKAIVRTIKKRINLIRKEVEVPYNNRTQLNSDEDTVNAVRSDEFLRAEVYVLRYIMHITESLRTRQIEGEEENEQR